MNKTPEYQTTRIWKQTIRTLNLISAMSGESIVKTMDRLATQELTRLQVAERKRRMIWHNDTQSYRGETSDGKVVDVTGDEYAESLADGVKAEAKHRGWDAENLTEEQREICENATYPEIDDADTWAGLIGDNPNVEYVKPR